MKRRRYFGFFFYFVKTCLLVFLISHCAHYDHNQVKGSSFHLHGGRKGNFVWGDQLLLQRKSWYYGATLLYEVNYSVIDAQSPFFNWFSTVERSVAEKCKYTLVTLEYCYDSRRVNSQVFRSEVLNLGYKEIVANDFEKEFINHPDMLMLSNKNYRTKLYCLSSLPEKSLDIVHPGFEKVSISF